jgi:transposase-like protein
MPPPKTEQQRLAAEIEAAEPGITTRELARRVGVSRDRIRAWRERGRLPVPAWRAQQMEDSQ